MSETSLNLTKSKFSDKQWSPISVPTEETEMVMLPHKDVFTRFFEWVKK